jgi:hypothetical protein
MRPHHGLSDAGGKTWTIAEATPDTVMPRTKIQGLINLRFPGFPSAFCSHSALIFGTPHVDLADNTPLFPPPESDSNPGWNRISPSPRRDLPFQSRPNCGPQNRVHSSLSSRAHHHPFTGTRLSSADCNDQVQASWVNRPAGYIECMSK